MLSPTSMNLDLGINNSFCPNYDNRSDYYRRFLNLYINRFVLPLLNFVENYVSFIQPISRQITSTLVFRAVGTYLNMARTVPFDHLASLCSLMCVIVLKTQRKSSTIPLRTCPSLIGGPLLHQTTTTRNKDNMQLDSYQK